MTGRDSCSDAIASSGTSDCSLYNAHISRLSKFDCTSRVSDLFLFSFIFFSVHCALTQNDENDKMYGTPRYLRKFVFFNF